MRLTRAHHSWLLLATTLLLLLLLLRHHSSPSTSLLLTFYDDDSTLAPPLPSLEEEELEELAPAASLGLPLQHYSFHPSCNCSRSAPRLSLLQARFQQQQAFWASRLLAEPLLVPSGVYVGESTCDGYTSALGAGQQVLSYSYYSPWRTARKHYLDNGKPTDTEERFLELLQPLAATARAIYPGWRVRIYHNITETDQQAFSTFCRLYCENDFIDLCDTRQLPGPLDLNSQFPIGRFWRFQVVADPTVAVFGSRDIDSFLTAREAAAVSAWLGGSGKQWHVMRDGPFHRSTMLAGLWGGHNYRNLSLARAVRTALLGVQPNLYKFYDQRILNSRVFPIVRDEAAIFDSYNCGIVWKFGHCRPWPTERKGYRYVGYGPTKNYAVKALRRKRCPVKCRPEAHKDWQYC